MKAIALLALALLLLPVSASAQYSGPFGRFSGPTGNIGGGGSGGTAEAIEVTDTTDTTAFCALFEATTGDLTAHTDAGCAYNAVTGVLTATGFAGPLTGAVTGNASTATALAANGTNCSSGEYARGVDASGNAEGCTATGGGGFDSTAIDNATWSDGANASNTWTFDVSGTDHTMVAGNGLMTFGDSVTVTDVLTTPTLTFSGTGTINGLDAIDGTTETTLEAAIDIAGDITGTGLGSVAITSGAIVNADVNASAAIVHSKMATALKTIFIPATAMVPTTTAGCADLTAVEISSSQPEVFSVDCDPSTDEKAQFQWVPPKGWDNGTITYALYWSHASTTTNFATVWGLECLAVSNDDTIGASYGTAVTVTDTGGTTNDLYVAPTSSAVTVGGTPQDADEVFCRAYRDADNGSDNLAIDARLMGIAIFYTQTTADDT
jgi:hypothetical protein